MALGQRRMVYTNLWQNTEFARLSDWARLLYIGLITIGDDDGRLKANAMLLKSQIFPLDKGITDKHIRRWLNEIVKLKLVTFYESQGEYYIQHPHWKKFQNIRPDRKRDSDIPPPNVGQMSDKSPHNIREVKLREEKENASLSYLKNIPEEDLKEFYERFDCSVSAIKSKGEDLYLWCVSNGRSKKDYKATLLNALKKDFPPRKSPAIIKKHSVDEEPDQDREKIRAMLKKTGEELGFRKANV